MAEHRTGRPAQGPAAVIERLFAGSARELRAATEDYAFRAELARATSDLATRAYRDADPAALAEVHETLGLIYDEAFGTVEVDRVDHDRATVTGDVAAILERAMLAHELARIVPAHITGYPQDGGDYVRWLKNLVNYHPAGWHPIYHRYLATAGTVDDLRLLLAQESSLDPRFDDILANLQIGRRGAEKMEIAGNYWDEMGNGDPSLVHTSLFDRALSAIGADPEWIRDHLMIESRMCGNLSACLALSRRHYFKAVGYFGVTEYLAPRRFRCVVDRWRHHGLGEAGITYHDLHIGIDAGHASGWFRNVVGPLLEADPRTGREIAAGALLRLNSSADYVDALAVRMSSGELAGTRG